MYCSSLSAALHNSHWKLALTLPWKWCYCNSTFEAGRTYLVWAAQSLSAPTATPPHSGAGWWWVIELRKRLVRVRWRRSTKPRHVRWRLIIQAKSGGLFLDNALRFAINVYLICWGNHLVKWVQKTGNCFISADSSREWLRPLRDPFYSLLMALA